MSDDDDLYATLGVSRTASEDDIRKAYRKLARKHHPDVNPGDAAAEARFKKLSAAYEILSKPETRALYAEFGKDAEKIDYDPERAEEYRKWRRQAEAASNFGGGAGGGVPFDFGGYGGGDVDFEDLLGDLFSRGPRARGGPRPRRGGDVEASLRIRFVDAARGATTAVEVPKRTADGRVEMTRLSITIPPGVETGQRLRLAGQGDLGRDGGPSGDLYVRIEVEDHPVLRRDGLDLELTLPITVPEAMCGASVSMPTLDGTVKLRVPPRSQSGQRLRLRGKGIKASGAEGDLYAVLEVEAPTGGDEATRARLASELESLYDEDVRKDLSRRIA